MRVNIVGVPDSTGAYCIGVEQAPAALRDAGLIESLTAVGCEVHDMGDLTARAWTPDRVHPYLQNLSAQLEATRELCDAAASALAPGERLLVLGGSCVVAVGVCAAFVTRGEDPRLIYIDRHLDLNTPQSTAEGSLSWMGMAHALASDGAARELVAVSGRVPMLRAEDLVYLGVDETQATDGERSRRAELEIPVVDQAALSHDPRSAARTARAALPPGAFFVHLDVDVLDFLDAPIAENVNGRNSGPTIAQLEQALVELIRDPDCRGLSIGQLDPAHAASDGTAITRLIAAISTSFAA